MDQLSTRPPQTPPFMPAQSWQRQGSSLHELHTIDHDGREPQGWQGQGSSLPLHELHTVDHDGREPQAAPQTPTQKLVAGLDPAKIQEVAASQVAMSDMYYTTSLQHAQRIFRWALIAVGVALIFFLVAVALQILQKSVNGALISLASGGVLTAIAMLNFWLSGRIFHQCRAIHERLDRTQQYLLANSLCEQLQGEVKQATQIELIRAMMHSLALQEEKTVKARET
jgi:hypothetical protein